MVSTQAGNTQPKRTRAQTRSTFGKVCLHPIELRNAISPKAHANDHVDPVSSQMLTRFAGPQLYAPSTETAVLDVFTDRFVDAFAPRDNSAECGAATSIRSAATIRMFSPLLQNAFSAVSTTFVGQQIDDQQIVHAGHGLYCTVLKDLQTALTHPIYSKSEAVLATVVLLIAYEVFQPVPIYVHV